MLDALHIEEWQKIIGRRKKHNFCVICTVSGSTTDQMIITERDKKHYRETCYNL